MQMRTVVTSEVEGASFISTKELSLKEDNQVHDDGLIVYTRLSNGR